MQLQMIYASGRFINLRVSHAAVHAYLSPHVTARRDGS